MRPLIVSKPVEVDERLSEFGMRREPLLAIIEAMVAAKADYTENDPPGADCWSAWRYGTRRARELLRHDGWEIDQTDQVPAIINRKLGMRIVIVNTDAATGVDGARAPQNNSKRGAATERMVDLTQLTLFGLLDESPSKVVRFKPASRDYKSIVTFYYCVFIDDDDVRAELSCAARVEGGFFESFSERIFIVGPGEWPPDASKRKGDEATGNEGSEFEIPVSRK